MLHLRLKSPGNCDEGFNKTLHKIDFSYYVPNYQQYLLNLDDNINLIKQYQRSILMLRVNLKEISYLMSSIENRRKFKKKKTVNE